MWSRHSSTGFLGCLNSTVHLILVIELCLPGPAGLVVGVGLAGGVTTGGLVGGLLGGLGGLGGVTVKDNHKAKSCNDQSKSRT